MAYVKPCEILPKFELIVVKGHPRLSILVYIESTCATSYFSLIVKSLLMYTLFIPFSRYRRIKPENSLFPLPQPCLTIGILTEARPAILTQSIHRRKEHFLDYNLYATLFVN